MFSGVPAIVKMLTPSPCELGLTFCSMVAERRSETAAACDQAAILWSIAAPLSEPAEIFAVFEIIDDETESVIVPFRQRYFVAEAYDPTTIESIIRPTAVSRVRYRI